VAAITRMRVDGTAQIAQLKTTTGKDGKDRPLAWG
jgi:hypothetical protein